MRSIFPAVLLAVVVSSAAAAVNYTDITSPQAKALLDKGGIYLLDVRTPREYQKGHLRGAVLIPVDQVASRLADIPKNKPVLVYCAVGSRSGVAAGLLAEKGYKDVYNMRDGIVGWFRNGLPLAR